VIAGLLRKNDHSIFENVGRLAKGSTSVSSIKSMTLVQRHAELVYSECTLLKVRRQLCFLSPVVSEEALRRPFSVSSTLEILSPVRPVSYHFARASC
jgi:hypothetical protein